MSRLQAVIHNGKIEVVSGQAITAEAQDSVHQALSFISVFLLVFAFIALFVGSFVIFNTFSITVAQRTRAGPAPCGGREPCPGDGPVLGESLVIGVRRRPLASARGSGSPSRQAALAALGFNIPATGLVINSRTIIVGLAVGTVITLVRLFPRPACFAHPAGRGHAGRGGRAAPAFGRAHGPRRGPGGRRCGGPGRPCPPTWETGSRWSAPARRRCSWASRSRAVRRAPGQPAGRGAPLAMRGATGKSPSTTRCASDAHRRDGCGADGRRDPRIADDHRRLAPHQGLGRSRSSVLRRGPLRGQQRRDRGRRQRVPPPSLERSLDALPQVSTTAGFRSWIVQLYGKATPIAATHPARPVSCSISGSATASWRICSFGDRGVRPGRGQQAAEDRQPGRGDVPERGFLDRTPRRSPHSVRTWR